MGVLCAGRKRRGIFGQRYAADGTPAGGEFQVNTYTINDQREPSVTALSDGGFLVIWQSYWQSGDNDGYGIFGRRYAADGTPAGGKFQINTYTINDQSEPSVTALSDGGFVATWTSWGQDGDDDGIYGQRYVINGLPEGEVLITGTPTEGQTLMANISGVTDSDGIDATTITYQWLREGIEIEGATASTYTLTPTDAGSKITVRLRYTDDSGTRESVTSIATNPVENVNDAPEGAVVIDGLAHFRQVLTANTSTVSDQDGLGAFSYQWYRGGIAITGATSVTYNVVGADIEEDLTVVVSYTDIFGQEESLVSAAVTPEALDPGLTTVVTDGESGEDGSVATFTIVLDSEIDSDVTIVFQVSDSTEAELLTSTVTFTADNWDVIQTVTINGLDDYDDDGDVSYTITGILTTDDLDYTGVSVVPISFLNIDDQEDADIQLYGTNAVDYLQGMNGDDRLYGLGNQDELRGGRGNDRLYGGYGDDRLYGDQGNDELYGEQDDDLLEGGAGNDELYGGGGSDILKGGDGNDILNGGTGVDTMIGGAGNDTYYVDRAGDVIRDNGLASDEDTVVVIGNFSYVLGNGLENVSLSDESGSVDLTGNSLDNKLTGNRADNTLKGGGGNDTLYSLGGNDIVMGGNGNDLIIGGSGAGRDTYRGGNGVDTVKYTSALAGISVDLHDGSARSIAQGNASGIGRDALFGIKM